MIEELKKLLIKHEAEVNYAYQDSEGYWTIGVGHLIDKGKGGKISHAAAMFILDEDITEVISQCDRSFGWFDDLSEVRKVVVLNMIFNLGLNNFKDFKKTIQYIDNENYEQAAIEMLDSKWASQVGQRAAELSEMMKNG